MMRLPLVCPECGKTETEIGHWSLGALSGPSIGGLDPRNCAGCWDVIDQAGGYFAVAEDGTPIPRPPEKERVPAV